MWLLDEVYYETSEELVDAYVDYIVEAAKKHPNTFQKLLSADRFQRMLINLGVSANAMGQGTKVYPVLQNDMRCKSPVSRRPEGTLGCKAFLRLVSAFPYQPSESAAFVLVLDSVLKMGLDASYTDELWQPAATSLTGLYDMARTNDQRWKEMVPRIEAVASYISDHSLFQFRVLRLLPARSYAERTLRKRIALQMFLPRQAETEKVMARPVSACLSHIKTSRPFHPLNSETDYIELGLQLQVLDIAIESPEEPEVPAARLLAEHLKLMHGRIVDSRAAFISRSEAKDVLQRIFLRLTYMVGKPNRGVTQATLDVGWTV
ncbi:hypothetical protein SAICODRAFT_65223 [Saitoella complicata NRRL Y-17804]|nr:uncharacterized protein SAICODRAFT_65223 [Saitoella complicata NRRL Y-17804]ODQ53559.1 hypothetical protein SAICODRAFT_65223 [Saitoella complicata NRRL Y-17804]